MSAAHVARVAPLHVDGLLERGGHPGIDRRAPSGRDLLVALGRHVGA